MRGKTTGMMEALVAITLLVGFAGVQKVEVQAAEKEPLAKIMAEESLPAGRDWLIQKTGSDLWFHYGMTAYSVSKLGGNLWFYDEETDTIYKER